MRGSWINDLRVFDNGMVTMVTKQNKLYVYEIKRDRIGEIRNTFNDYNDRGLTAGSFYHKVLKPGMNVGFITIA